MYLVSKNILFSVSKFLLIKNSLYIYIKILFYETFRETFMKPYETFYPKKETSQFLFSFPTIYYKSLLLITLLFRINLKKLHSFPKSFRKSQYMLFKRMFWQKETFLKQVPRNLKFGAKLDILFRQSYHFA